jgi:hypothetical protein
MDDNSRKRRRGGYATGSIDRYRAAPPMTTPPSAGRGIGGPSSGYSYYIETTSTFPTALPANTMHHQPEYGPDQRSQSFSSYSLSMMYNFNQQGPQSAVYEAAQHFQQRQPAAMQLLPEVAGSYYAGEPSNPPAAPITNGMTQGPAEFMEEQVRAGMDEAYNSYLNALKEIFQNIRNGMLVEASSSLIEVSNWLLSHVTELGEPPFTAHVNQEALTVLNKGLDVDDVAAHGERFRLWDEFNTAWLAVLQKQKDLTLDYIYSGNPPRHPQSLISHDFLNKMAKELIRLCDNIEKHGLVDYQYGVWEETIITS